MSTTVKLINFFIILGLTFLIVITPWFYGSVYLKHQSLIFAFVTFLFLLKVIDRTLDIGHRTLDIGLRTLDLGPRTLDLGHRTLDIGHRTFLTPLSLILLLSGVSILFSIYPYQSYVSFLKLLAWISLFYLIINTIKTNKLLYYFLWIIIITSIFYSIYGLFQYKGLIDKSFWAEQTSLASRYVNSNHFAGYLEMAIFILPGLFIYFKRLWQKLLICVFSLPIFYAFIYTRSRFGWLSFLITLIIFFILALKFLKKYRRQIILLLIIATLILIILPFFGPDVITTRIKQISGTRFQSMIQRLNIGISTLKAFIHYPWGSGLGTFKYIYPEFRIHSDRFSVNFAHNEYLQTLLELGIFGFLVLIWLIARYFRFIFNGLNRQNGPNGLNSPIIISLSCALISLLIHSFLDFPLRIPANMFLFTILAGILISSLKIDLGHRTLDLGHRTLDLGHRTNSLAKLFTKCNWLIFFLCILLIPLYFRLYFADTYFRLAEKDFKTGKWNNAIKSYKKAIDIISPDSLYFERLGTIYSLKANLISKNKNLYIKNAKGYFIKAIKSNSHNYNAHLNLAWIYANFIKDKEKAIYHFEKAVKFNPTDAAYHLNFADYLLEFGKIDYAIEEYKKSFQLFAIEKRGRSPVRIFSHCFKYTKDYDKLKNLIPENNIRLHFLLGNFLADKGNWQQAEQEFKKVKKLEPDNIKFRLNIASIYEKYGKIKQAISEYKQVLELDPNNKRAKEEIEKLSKGN